ncbi:Uncharacterised protein [Sphingomonas paucimobilis]|nr:Uncharacterised protein [Sphingomonas paucimobilis]
MRRPRGTTTPSLEIKGQGTDFFSVSPFYKKLNHVLFATGTTNAGGDYNIWGNPQSEQQGGVEVSSLTTDATGQIYGVEFFGRYSLRACRGCSTVWGLQANVTLQKAKANVLRQRPDARPAHDPRRPR